MGRPRVSFVHPRRKEEVPACTHYGRYVSPISRSLRVSLLGCSTVSVKIPKSKRPTGFRDGDMLHRTGCRCSRPVMSNVPILIVVSKQMKPAPFPTTGSLV